jgi:hypothetical protein
MAKSDPALEHRQAAIDAARKAVQTEPGPGVHRAVMFKSALGLMEAAHQLPDVVSPTGSERTGRSTGYADADDVYDAYALAIGVRRMMVET